MEQALKEKFETIIKLVDNVMVDPDLDVDYCIPEVETTSESCDVSGDPYIMVSYAGNKYTQRKIKLNDKYLPKTAEEIANYVIFFIEQYKEEIDAANLES